MDRRHYLFRCSEISRTGPFGGESTLPVHSSLALFYAAAFQFPSAVPVWPRCMLAIQEHFNEATQEAGNQRGKAGKAAMFVINWPYLPFAPGST